MRLIDADKLDEVVLVLNQKGWTITRNDYKRIDGVLFEFPTVDPVKHRRWIERKDGELLWDECSTCGYVNEYERFPYCPNCGAKMDEMQKKPCDDCQQFDCYGCEYAERKEND